MDCMKVYSENSLPTNNKILSLKVLLQIGVIILLFFVQISFSVLGDEPIIEWEKTFSGLTSGNSVKQTSPNGYVVVGPSSVEGGYPKISILKTGPSGSFEWKNSFGRSDYNYAESIQQTRDNGYIIAGASYDPETSDKDVYLVKTNSKGEKEWAKIFNGSSSDHAYSVMQTNDGGYIVGGDTQCKDSSGSTIGAWLIKTDSKGKEEWEKKFTNHRGRSVKQTSDGGYIFAGFALEGNTEENWRASVWLMKTDSSGGKEWSKLYAGSHADFRMGEIGGIGFSVDLSRDGGYIVAGSARLSDNEDYDGYLVKTDSSGNKEWEKFFGGPSDDQFASVAQVTHGGYVAAGTKGISYSQSVLSHEGWVVKVDKKGIDEWQKTFNNSQQSVLYSVEETADYSFAPDGSLVEEKGYILSGAKATQDYENAKLWLVKLKGLEEVPDWRSELRRGDLVFSRGSEALKLLGLTYTHVGIYLGDGKVYEASTKGGVRIADIEVWDQAEAAAALRVKGASGEQIEGAISFIDELSSKERSYQFLYVNKCPSPDYPMLFSKAWYCSELVWAAFSSQGIHLQTNNDLGTAIPPDEIVVDDDTELLGIRGRIEDPISKEVLLATVQSPVDLTLVSPNGKVISKSQVEIPNSFYLEYDFDDDGHMESAISIPEGQIEDGNYSIDVSSKPDANPTDTYRLQCTVNGATRYLAKDVQVTDIPEEPYEVDSTHNTPAGDKIMLNFSDVVHLTFDHVDTKGNTTMSRTTSLPFDLPSDLSVLGKYYNCDSTASYTNNITITIKYDDTDLTTSEEEILNLYKITEEGKVTDITTSHDFKNNSITGKTDSFSYFAVGYETGEEQELERTFEEDQWYLISMPLESVPNSCEEIVEDDLPFASSCEDLVWGPWDGSEYGHPTSLSPFEGYWLYAPSEFTVDVSGTIPTNRELSLSTSGWHMIGSPVEINWGDVKIKESGENYNDIKEIDFTQSEEPLLDAIFAYDPSIGDYVVASEPDWDSYTLDPWNGYWVYVRDQSNVPVYLNFSDIPVPPSPPSRTKHPEKVTLSTLKGSFPSPPPHPQATEVTHGPLRVMAYLNQRTNPARVNFVLTGEGSSQSSGIKVRVQDLSGRIVFTAESDENVIERKTGDMANGIYLYSGKVRTKNGFEQTNIGKILILN